jgi:2-dehydro-3-deoxy-D-arabinonate dehydratase
MQLYLYRTRERALVRSDEAFFVAPEEDFDALLNRPDLVRHLAGLAERAQPVPAPSSDAWLAPVGTQEIWAAGVTYERSREGRREEAKDSGAADFYSRVYNAERPELFFKSPGWRAVGPNAKIRIRQDARWNVPEPELALVINRGRQIVGYTLGNDVSSRDIEGENPLYLPQAKVYDGSCALGPALCLSDESLDLHIEICITVERAGRSAFQGSVPLNKIRRPFGQLVEYLFRELTFPVGAFLLTGTGIVPPNDFTLASGDVVRIAAGPIGELVNQVA